MKRQPKSGSKSHRNKIKVPVTRQAVVERADGTREIPLNDEMVALLEKQRQAFRAKFGREPEGKDPIFFDPDCDVPTRLTEEKLERARKYTAEAMERVGIRPEISHAFLRTGRLLTKENEHLVPAEGIKEWNAAITEYFEWQRMAEDALKAGAHPGIAYAISKTGKLAPDGAQFSEDMSHAVACGDDADWLEALREYAKRHPESCDPAWLSPADPLKDRVH